MSLVSKGSAASGPVEAVDFNATNVPKEVLADVRKAFQKPLIRQSDMNGELQSEAVDMIVSAIDKCQGNFESAAKHIKEQMDKKFGPAWHCMIGEGFGFGVTFQQDHMVYLFYQGHLAVLLFKC